MNEVTVQLPIGIFNGDFRYRNVTIKPMTGGTQKKLASKQVRSDPVKLINALLLDCVVSIEGQNRITNTVVNSLYIGDRDFLAMEIRKISRGNELITDIVCPHCKEKLRMTSDLSTDIGSVALEDVDYTLVDGVPQFTLTDPESDFNATFTFPDGNAQASVVKYIMKNPVEGVYALMLRCLVDWNGKDPKDVTLAVFDEISVTLSDYLMDNFQKNCPGPEFEIPAECSNCGNDIRLTMASSDFLFRLRD